MVKDPIKKIKKTSKFQADIINGMSGKKKLKKSNSEVLDTEIKDNNNKSQEECVTPRKKHKKAKRKHETPEENGTPLKKLKNKNQEEPTTLTKKDPPVTVDYVHTSKKVVKSEEQKEKQSVVGAPAGVKDSLMSRLRSESVYLKGVLSLIHIPKHKSVNDASDDEVSDITPEVRRQMRIKLQAQMKSHPRAHNLTQLQERLRIKLAELRGGDLNAEKGKGKKKKKLTKAEKKQKARVEKKLKAKLARGEPKMNGQKLNVPAGAKPAKPVYNNDGKMVFSKFDFTNSERAIGGGGGGDAIKSTLDPKAALGKIQKKKEKIQSLQAIGKTERAKSIEEKSVWKSAMEKAEGVKVKDDEILLKKTIKRLDQKKKSSKKKWEGRVEGEEKRKNMKQHKRSENIKKRKHDTKQNKFKKFAKKGRSIPGFR